MTPTNETEPLNYPISAGLYNVRVRFPESTLKQLQDLARSNFRTLPAEIRYLVEAGLRHEAQKRSES